MPDATTTPEFGDDRLPQRFWDKARVEPDGCWHWTACKSIGYGKFGWNGKSVHAHLVSYRTLIGQIPEGLVADHECHDPATCPGGTPCTHRSCVNPSHIGLKTNAENTSRGRMSHWNLRKTHCPNGHEYSTQNTRRDRNGTRWCKECERNRSAQRFHAYRDGQVPSPPQHTVTCCRHGHEYTPENSGTNASGARYCRTCQRLRGKVSRDAYRAANPIQVKTHCPQGHEYTLENTLATTSGRKCRACGRERARAARARKRQ
jgi:hypothetical protein